MVFDPLPAFIKLLGKASPIPLPLICGIIEYLQQRTYEPQGLKYFNLALHEKVCQPWVSDGDSFRNTAHLHFLLILFL